MDIHTYIYIGGNKFKLDKVRVKVLILCQVNGGEVTSQLLDQPQETKLEQKNILKTGSTSDNQQLLKLKNPLITKALTV